MMKLRMIQNNLINIVLKIMRTLLDRCRKSTVILIIFFFRTVIRALMKYLHVGKIDDITHSMENLNLDIPIV